MKIKRTLKLANRILNNITIFDNRKQRTKDYIAEGKKFGSKNIKVVGKVMAYQASRLVGLGGRSTTLGLRHSPASLDQGLQCGNLGNERKLDPATLLEIKKSNDLRNSFNGEDSDDNRRMSPD